ncbi:hypothetical protein N7539_005867 [Penicillium diatomitis]|uniref:Uncharacterized protein n=1 Tax=Penicillium diatomitis TaxID=2819901 RepID=A0A9W9X5C7_9EURO|nr:uncharacterized protein N7539_005867 [Penicillium diatomitis]KAJ5484071.1 hypothetical protein N7539_005867 [Penicillium diatomitis]
MVGHVKQLNLDLDSSRLGGCLFDRTHRIHHTHQTHSRRPTIPSLVSFALGPSRAAFRRPSFFFLVDVVSRLWDSSEWSAALTVLLHPDLTPLTPGRCDSQSTRFILSHPAPPSSRKTAALNKPDMPALFPHNASPPKVDLASANSQFCQFPISASASSSLYTLSLSRKRPRRDAEKLATKFQASSEVASASALLQPTYPYSTGYGGVDLDYRPNRYRESFLPPSLENSVESIDDNSLGTSRKRTRRDSLLTSPGPDVDSPESGPIGWGRTVINVVGKVLDLCWSGAFRGFYAGGGQGYDLPTSLPSDTTPSWEKESMLSEKEKECLFHSPIPGQYPEDELERSWVVIPSTTTHEFTPDLAATRSMRSRRVHQASSPRRRSAVMPKSQKKTSASRGSSTPTQSPSLPSPRLREGPDSAEMKRVAAQIRRREREEDASIKRLNRQLQAMIREGKQALGSKVEVDDLEMDFD